MNITAGVAALQPFQRQLEGLEACRDRFAGQRQRGDKVDTARATHVDFAFLFGIGIDQDIRLQPVRLQTKGAIHTGFFGHGQQYFQRAMLNAIVCQHRQRRGHTDTVIRTQSGAAGFNPLAVDVRLNRIFGEIVYGVVVLLWNHVQVRLQHNRFTVFHPGGGRFTDQNVANLVAFGVQPFFLRPAHDVFGKLFFVIRRVRN